MSQPAVVSVVVPIRNPEPELFGQCLRSLASQTLRELEVIVVETPGGTPATPLVERHGDGRFRLVTYEGAPSISAARNLGIASASAELVAMLDGDDEAMPERLARQHACFSEDPTLSVLGSNVEQIDARGATLGWRRFPLHHDEIFRTFRIRNPICQPSVMFRKSDVLELGGYRDSTCEDYELWSRMARAGKRFANLEEPLTRYRLHDSSMKAKKLRASIRDTIRIKRLHWHEELDFAARLRLLQERALLALPAGLVLRLFRKRELHDSRPGGDACAS